MARPAAWAGWLCTECCGSADEGVGGGAPTPARALPDAVLGPKRDDGETTSPPAESTLPAMVLNTHSIYPSAGRYVLRLHRDARPENGQLSGRIEHVSGGDSIDFATGAELLAWLARHAAETREPPADFQTAPKEPR